MVTGSSSFRVKNRGGIFTFHAGMVKPSGWLDPAIDLAYNHRLSAKQLRETEVIIREHLSEIVNAWQRHFGN